MLAHVRKIRLRWWILLALAVFVAQHIARWGRPLAAHYAVKRTTANDWRIERLASPHETGQARDTDADGVLDEFQTPAGSFARPELRTDPRRWLVICVDGVPLEIARRLWERGHFRELHSPSAVISSFPTDSETALTEVLHAAPVPGYEHRYFDRAQNEIRGGAWVTMTGKNLPYLRVLHYDAPGW